MMHSKGELPPGGGRSEADAGGEQIRVHVHVPPCRRFSLPSLLFLTSAVGQTVTVVTVDGRSTVDLRCAPPNLQTPMPSSPRLVLVTMAEAS